MSTIATSLTEKQFNEHVRPYVSVAQRGYESSIPLYKIFNYILYRLHTGCQWEMLPIEKNEAGEAEISWQAVYHHWRKWNGDGSLKRVWEGSIKRIRNAVDTSELNLDGSHVIAKKGGEGVAYQGRKKAKTTNILPITDKQGFVLAVVAVRSGNHNDVYQIKPDLQAAFKHMKQLGLRLTQAYFNADSAFDSRETRRVCWNYGLIPNIPENKRNRKTPKRGRKRAFNASIYKNRFTSERSFAWIDKFRALLIRFEKRLAYFIGGHYLAFAMINLRHIIAGKV